MIDTLMMAYTVEMVSVEKVAACAQQYSAFFQATDLPYDIEDAVMYWINKVGAPLGGSGLRTVDTVPPRFVLKVCAPTELSADIVTHSVLVFGGPEGWPSCGNRVALFMRDPRAPLTPSEEAGPDLPGPVCWRFGLPSLQNPRNTFPLLTGHLPLVFLL